MSKGKETRERIVAEAAALFNQRGFEGGSMSELMKATGLEKGGIYRHFSSKAELAAAAFDYAWQETAETRMHALDQVPNSVDQLIKFVDNFVRRRTAVPGGCPLLNTAIDADDGNLVLRERALKSLRTWRDRLAAIISDGARRKEIKRSVSPTNVANLIISVLEGSLMVSRLERNRDAVLNAQRFLEQYLENEVRIAKKSSSSAR